MGHQRFHGIPARRRWHIAGMTTFGGPMAASDFGAATLRPSRLDHCWACLKRPVRIPARSRRTGYRGRRDAVRAATGDGFASGGTPHLPRVWIAASCSSRTPANTPYRIGADALPAPFRGNSGAAARCPRRVQRLRARSERLTATMWWRWSRIFARRSVRYLYRPALRPCARGKAHAAGGGHCR